MMLSGHLLAVLLIPVVSGFDGFVAHQKAHESGSVRHLKAKETVYESGSDFVFSWAKCVICDGYDVRLYLEDVSGTRETPYKLKSAMTALKVTNVPPRTVYKLVVKRLPTDDSSSEVSGRSFTPEAPSPVEELQARAVTTSSIKIEWRSKKAEGFICRIFEKKKLVFDHKIPDFRNHSTLDVINLKPETDYVIHVTSFYFPPTGKSTSAVSSVRVKTLPLILPRINLRWKYDQEPKVFWKNPASPAPVAHRVTCTRSSSTVFRTRMSGPTDFVELSAVTGDSAIECVLETWFSEDKDSKVTSTARLQKPVKSSPPSSSQSDAIGCRDYYDGYPEIATSGTYERERVDGTDFIVLKFAYSKSSKVKYEELQYKICVGDGSCEKAWITSKEYSRVVVSPREMKAWVSHTVYFRFKLSCTTRSYSYGSSEHTTTTGSFKVPASRGIVDPVYEISSTATQVSWRYSASSPSPDYFLVTHCTGDSCMSQSVPGQNHSISLGELKPRHVYFVTIQAVKLWEGEALVSATKMTSIVAPKPTAPDGVAVTYKEIGNSSTVQLVIAHNATTDEPPIVEYHVAVCSKPVSLWKDPSLTRLLSSNGSCDSIVSSNSSLDLIREPWTFYEVSVLVCHGSFDFNDPVNLTLPIFKPRPSPLAGLTWDAGSATLKWKFDATIPTGFSVSICPSVEEKDCNATVVDPLDRQYSMDASKLTGAGSVAVVHAFVTYEGVDYDGPSSRVLLSTPSTTPSNHQNTTERSAFSSTISE